MIGVYRIVAPSGSAYVGMTCDSFANRKSGHLKELRSGVHKNIGLTRAYAKYGETGLRFEVLEAFDKPATKDALLSLGEKILQREVFWWEHLKSEGVNLYNGKPTGTGSVFHTAESRAKLSKTLLAKNLELTRSRMMPCEHCGETFHSRGGTSRFCSVRCASRSRPAVVNVSKEELLELYVTQDKSVQDLVKHFQCSQRSVYYALQKHSIPLKRGRIVIDNSEEIPKSIGG